MSTDHVVTLDEDTADYYGSDVSSVSNIPDGFNDVSREEPWEESDTESATGGLPDGFNDRAADDHIGPDPEAIAQSVGDGGGGDQAPTGPNTDIAGAQSAYAATGSASLGAGSGSSDAGDEDDGSEAEDEDEGPAKASMSSSLGELQEQARGLDLDDDGTKQELVDRINAELDS